MTAQRVRRAAESQATLEPCPYTNWAIGPRTSPYDRWLLTQAELASLLEISERQIQNLETRGLPHQGHRATKLYPIPDAAYWYFAYRRRLDSRSGRGMEADWFDIGIARAEQELREAQGAAPLAAGERRMYGRELTSTEMVALAERAQYLRGRHYLDALVAGEPLPPLHDEA